jgi:hypothetical protein
MVRPWLRGQRRRRAGRQLPTNLWRRPARLRHTIREAIDHGYVLGQSVQGGAYAISMTALAGLTVHRFLDDALLWLNTDLVEDVMMSMLVMASGMQLLGFAANGEVFGVLHKGLPDLPERLIERGYGIIHSIRNDSRFSEEQIRTYFRKCRRQQKSQAASSTAAFCDRNFH